MTRRLQSQDEWAQASTISQNLTPNLNKLKRKN